MNNRNFPRNYSQNDIRKLMHQGQKKADYINRILDTDVHINMASECNSPLKEKPKYLRNRFKLNSNRNNYNEKNGRYEILERYDNNINNINNISNSARGPNYLDKSYKELFNNNYKNRNNEYNYNYNYNINENNNDLNNSLNLNKPFHRERRHFPLVNNKGNFFKNITPFLVGNTERLKLIRSQNIDNDKYRNNNIPKIYRPYENNIKRYQVDKLKRSSSMDQMPINRSYNNINVAKNNYQDEYDENHLYSIGNDLSRKYKFYNPYRYDYEGSRYGDNTYNYYLNAPMRSDISADWKFPPLYYYNYNSINEKKKNYSNY